MQSNRESKNRAIEQHELAHALCSPISLHTMSVFTLVCLEAPPTPDGDSHRLPHKSIATIAHWEDGGIGWGEEKNPTRLSKTYATFC